MTSIEEDRKMAENHGLHPPEDPPIRWGIWAQRSASSIFGAAESWCKKDGVRLEFDTEREAIEKAMELNANTSSAKVSYTVRMFY
jgi:hypothetical protein